RLDLRERRLPIERDRAGRVGADLRVREDPVRRPVAATVGEVERRGRQADDNEWGAELLAVRALRERRVEGVLEDVVRAEGPSVLVDEADSLPPGRPEERRDLEHRPERG